ncbi:MAG TPA: VOC family protein [Roseiarcus sp.]|jgi:catechol 2,3-dioxygenase-like lactoylglutathione lyase family enzyme
MSDRSSPPPIAGLLETSLYARDLKRTAAFYRDLFGLSALVDSPRLVAFDVAARSVLLVFQAGSTERDVDDTRGRIPGHDGRGRPHLALSIASDDLDAWRKRLVERGVEVVGEYRWPRGGTSLYIRDPDDALVELATPGLWW